MPLYTYKCPECGFKEIKFRAIPRRDDPMNCAILHPAREMQRMVEAPAVHGDFAGYSCPVTGKWIEGRRAHEENLKRQGARVLEPGETQGYIKARAAEDTEFEKSVGETVDAALATMPTQKVEQLVTELQAGADVSYQRATGKVAQNGS